MKCIEIDICFCLDVQSYLGRRKVRDLSNWTMQVPRVLVEVSLLTLSLFFSMENLLLIDWKIFDFQIPKHITAEAPGFESLQFFLLESANCLKALKKKLLHLCCGPVVLRII